MECLTYLNPLVKLQKWAVRIIVGAKRRDSTAPIFEKLKLLRINEIYVYFVLLLMYKYHHVILPYVIFNLFTRNSSIHTYSTRQQNVLHIPFVRSSMSLRNIRVTGVKIYNHFIDKLEWNSTYVTFKYNAKKFILENNVTSIL